LLSKKVPKKFAVVSELNPILKTSVKTFQNSKSSYFPKKFFSIIADIKNFHKKFFIAVNYLSLLDDIFF